MIYAKDLLCVHKNGKSVLYHITPKANMKSIMEKGLVFDPSTKSLSRSRPGLISKGIYLVILERTTLSYIHLFEKMGYLLPQLAMIEATLPPFWKLYIDQMSEMRLYEPTVVYSLDSIPPNRLRLRDDLIESIIMVREYKADIGSAEEEKSCTL